MPGTQLDRLAELLVRHCTRVRRGDLVTIVAEPLAMAAVEAVVRETLRAGGHPSFHPRSDRLRELLVRHGNDEQLRHISPFESHRLATCDVIIVLVMRTDPIERDPPDPRRLAIAESARKELLSLSLARGAAGALRYTLAEIPGERGASELGMSLAEYEAWVYRACLLHRPDPVAEWDRLLKAQESMRAYLEDVRTLQFRSPAAPGRHDGTDLTVDVSGRTWINCGGSENMPDGELFSGPAGVDGVVNFTAPAWYRGTLVEGVRLAFRDGRVVEASATRNEAFLQAMLDSDDGSRAVGEIALGTNYELTRVVGNPLFDEKVGGTFHLAVGAGFPQTGNANESSLHWDLVSDLRPGATFEGSPGGTVLADGVVIQRDGIFTDPSWPRPGA